MKSKLALILAAILVMTVALTACTGLGGGNKTTTTAADGTSSSDASTTAKAPAYTLPPATSEGQTGDNAAASDGATAAGTTSASISSTGVSVAGNQTASSTYAVGNYTVNTQTDPLSLRLEPKSESIILTTIPKGSAISVIAVYGEWGYVVYQTTGGWVAMKYLAKA